MDMKNSDWCNHRLVNPFDQGNADFEALERFVHFQIELELTVFRFMTLASPQPWQMRRTSR